LETRFTAPRTPVEAKLATIWSQALRLEQIGIYDNFFELGGDSILAIQVIALARESGITLTPRLLFENQTIAELAAVAVQGSEISTAAQLPVQGNAPLVPIQHWFFEQELANPFHYNQSFIFTVSKRLDLSVLERALAHLERHHDALRIRFATVSSPTLQIFASPSNSVPLEHADLTSVADGALREIIELRAADAQQTLNYIDGPVWRVVYFDCGPQRSARVLIVVHHLAVDGVSWRILLEDLERCYQQEAAGESMRLPQKTTSVKEWAERLSTFMDRNEVPGGVRYWHENATDRESAVVPIDLDDGENLESSARTIAVCLDVAETEALLQQAPSAYNTQINDLLLTALGQALHEWTGKTCLEVNVEGHGREDFIDGINLSRTVGWFTSIYPVRLQMTEQGIGEQIKSIKEQVHALPARGIGYGLQRYLRPDPMLRPEPQILFNYFGQFDQVVRGSGLFAFAEEGTGAWHSPQARRRYLIEINSLVKNGRLEVAWTYSSNRHVSTTIEKLSFRFLFHLRQIIGHCLGSGIRSRTPSDFPLSAINQKALDVLVEQIPNLEDVYGLSPIQSLFYAAGVNDSRSVIDQWHGTLEGPLNLENFRHAWEIVSQWHPILRSTFHSLGLKEPVQVVHPTTAQPWRFEDWRDFDPTEQDTRWAQLLKTDRALEIRLDQVPLSRLTLIQLAEQRFKFLWTVSSLLLDGWSWPLVFRDLSRAYQSLGHPQPVDAGNFISYREYIAWHRGRQERIETEQFWRTNLRDVVEPTPLVAETTVSPSDQQERRSQWRAQLPPTVCECLSRFARQLQITPNSLIQGAWALVLSRLSRRSDVIFGAAFSGRPTELNGSERIVGPFVNNLPVRAKVDPSSTVQTFLQQLHAHLLQLNPHQFAPLSLVQSWTDVPWRDRLFDSIVVVQNYLVDDRARRLGGDVTISDFVGPIHTNFPLLVLIEPEAAWRVSLIYDPNKLSEATIRRWGADFTRTLSDFPESASVPLSALLERLSSSALAAAKPQRFVQSQNYVLPHTDTERRIARVWEEMLEIEKISAEENIFDLGVHSLLAVQLHRSLCDVLGQEFPLISMFQYPTIQMLARHLEQRDERVPDLSLRNRAQLQRNAVARLQPAAGRR
jgi:non-ribosomal peptide synthase protein (TIGR01720 family)